MFSAVKLNLNILSLNYLKVLFIELYLHKITTISSEAYQSLIQFGFQSIQIALKYSMKCSIFFVLDISRIDSLVLIIS